MRFEGGVWDADLRAVFVATERVASGDDGLKAEPAVEAIDLSTGKVLWRTPCSGQPVAVLLTRVVVAQWRRGVSLLTLWLLNSGDGGVAAQHVLPLPFWTALPGTDVTVEAVWEMDGRVAVLWRGVSVYAGGAAPPPEIQSEQTRDVRGGFVLDPVVGSAKEVSAASLTPPPPPSSLPTIDVRLSLHHEPVAALSSRSANVTLTAYRSADSSADTSADSSAASGVLWRHHLRTVIWLPPPPPPQ